VRQVNNLGDTKMCLFLNEKTGCFWQIDKNNGSKKEISWSSAMELIEKAGGYARTFDCHMGKGCPGQLFIF